MAAGHARTSRDLNEWLIGHLTLSTSARVLDAGCGTGTAARAILNVVPDGFVDAIDHSPDMVSVARARNAPAMAQARLMVHEAEATDPPFGPRTFDAIVGVHVAYYWADVTTTLRALARTLKPGGQIALGITYAHNMPGRSARRLTDEGFHTFVPNELAGEFRRAGAERVREEAQPGARGVLVRGTFP